MRALAAPTGPHSRQRDDDPLQRIGDSPVNVFHHPAFQSLVLPLLLAAMGLLLLRSLPGPAGRHWAPLGVALGLLAALAVLPAFGWPAATRVQKLPWVVLAGVAAAALAMAYPAQGERGRRRLAWSMAALCWAAASAWLAGPGTGWLQLSAWGLAGAAVLALLARGGPAQATSDRAPQPTAPSAEGLHAAAALTVAASGLAALAASGGSLLLAQLAAMLVAATAVPCLWAWLRPRSGVEMPSAALMPLGLAWLGIAMALSPSGVQDAARLALLALAFAVPWLLARSAGFAHRTRWAPAVVVALAAVPVALALSWQFAAGTALDAPGTVEDDAYYTPQWR